MENFAKLKLIRKKLGLNQKEMAEKLFIKQPYYSALETGKRDITRTVINDLINDIGVSPTWLYHNRGDVFIDAAIKSQEIEAEKTKPNEAFYAKNAQFSSFDIFTIVPEILDDIIKEKLFYMDFYLAAISQHLYSKSDKETADTKDLKEVVKFIKSLTNKHSPQFQTELRPAYLDLNTADKAKLIKELEGYIRTILDKIWLVTRDLKEVKL